MKKLLSLTFCLIFYAAVFAQYDGPEAPNYKEIEKNIRDSSSAFYYEDLMKRYLSGDSTMNIDQHRHLYFGYIFQPDYNPVDDSKYNSMLSGVLNKQHFSEQDLNNITTYAQALLAEDPFNMRALNALLLVFAQKDEVKSYKSTVVKRNIVERAIVSSGDGMSKKTAYYVIKVAHEYDILGFLGFSYGGSEKIEKGCKCNSLTLGKNPFEVDKLYFEISPVFNFASQKGRGKI